MHKRALSGAAVFLILAGVILGGCAGMQPVKPLTTNQTLYQVETSYTAVLSILADLAATGKMDKAFYREEVQPRRLQIEAALDVARGVLPNVHTTTEPADPLVRAATLIADLKLLVSALEAR